MKAKAIKILLPLILFSGLVYALTAQEMEIAANLEFFEEYEIIERDDFQEVYVDKVDLSKKLNDEKLNKDKNQQAKQLNSILKEQ